MAVFSEQGTSASHMAAAKICDAIARLPGNNGEDADATGAYTQAFLGKDCPATYITLPKEWWPKHWHGKFKNPVVRLDRALYGHPLAGLYWEKHCRASLLKARCRPVKSWEYLFVHEEKQLFLSVYVDDFK